jgi:predicted anti-sigma-YlaC factor YlaD
MTERSEMCRHLQGALAMRALGRADELDAALDDHLAGCPDCRAELADLADAAGGVLLVDPATPRDTTHPPLDLPVRILAQVGAEAARRRRRRIVAIAAALVLGLAGAGFMVASFGGNPPSDATDVQLTGESGASGTATLTERDWGTEVELHADGLRAGEVYWLWLTDAGGQRVGAGTFIGTGRSMTAVLASALPTEETRRIWLTDEADAIVLDATIQPTN